MVFIFAFVLEFISVTVFVFVKLDFEEARIGMTTGVKVASYRVATEKWPGISLRRKIVVNSLNYQPFYTLTILLNSLAILTILYTLTHVSLFMNSLNYDTLYNNEQLKHFVLLHTYICS